MLAAAVCVAAEPRTYQFGRGGIQAFTVDIATERAFVVTPDSVRVFKDSAEVGRIQVNPCPANAVAIMQPRGQEERLYVACRDSPVIAVIGYTGVVYGWVGTPAVIYDLAIVGARIFGTGIGIGIGQAMVLELNATPLANPPGEPTTENTIRSWGPFVMGLGDGPHLTVAGSTLLYSAAPGAVARIDLEANTAQAIGADPGAQQIVRDVSTSPNSARIVMQYGSAGVETVGLWDLAGTGAGAIATVAERIAGAAGANGVYTVDPFGAVAFYGDVTLAKGGVPVADRQVYQVPPADVSLPASLRVLPTSRALLMATRESIMFFPSGEVTPPPAFCHECLPRRGGWRAILAQ
ncbi:hypothetical protein [uncultured Thiodictyon sp.]|uniref:hypothetical protein n=1 Tax=uncultured Thiodictyon sp. TaxID=1846217 RepID=UPI0025EEF58E|nr:hypothetical protein [uncultured Thiodictyon sp.]